jgi:two-component system, NtrC family, sensor kinase
MSPTEDLESHMPNDSETEIAVSQASGSGTEKLIAIGRLAGHAAHKINNCLTTILTFSHLMKEKANMDAQDREDLDLIIREAMQAATLARQLQDVSRSGD